MCTQVSASSPQRARAGLATCATRLATSAHLALAEEEPVHGDVLLQRERDEEVGVRRRAAVPRRVLLIIGFLIAI